MDSRLSGSEVVIIEVFFIKLDEDDCSCNENRVRYVGYVYVKERILVFLVNEIKEKRDRKE